MQIIKKIFIKIYKKKYPEKYARKIGVNLLGNTYEIYPNVFWGSEPYLITLGNNVRITRDVKFITHDGGVWTLRNKYMEKDIDVFGKIEVGDNVHIGMNAIIMPGVKIGNNCVIGCGAVVTKSVEDNMIVGGIPAKPIESIEEYYKKVKKKCDYTKSLNNKSKKEYLLKKFDMI